MIITQTPYRISLCGGGTDFPSFYKREPGRVLSVSIDKYLFVVARRQIGLVEHKYRVNYSIAEFCNTIDDIQHPIVREALKICQINFPIEISTFADIPAFTGLGSSSAFAVGLLNALYGLKNVYRTKEQLASEAAKIEIEILGRQIGKQDHYASAYGGLNTIQFMTDGSVVVTPVLATREVLHGLNGNLMLFYTGIKRDASAVLEKQEAKKDSNIDNLRFLRNQVDELRDILAVGSELDRVGEMLHQGWLMKKKLSPITSTPDIDQWYDRATTNGSLGGKLLGAGGGGFLLFYVPDGKQAEVKSALAGLFHVPFAFEKNGTHILHYSQPNI